MTQPAIPPRDPQSEIRTRKALDRLKQVARALIVSGVLTQDPDGTVVVNTIIQQILDGQLDDIEEAIDALETTGELTLEERLNQCKNALRFLGVEPNEFPTEDSFPEEGGL